MAISKKAIFDAADALDAGGQRPVLQPGVPFGTHGVPGYGAGLFP